MTFLGWSFVVLDAGTVEMPYNWRSELLYPTPDEAAAGARLLTAGRVSLIRVYRDTLYMNVAGGDMSLC